MFDTHCHLNFKVFKDRVGEVIEEAEKVGVNYFVVPGSNIETSKKAVEIAGKYHNVYAAVGIHPHHIKKYQISNIKYQKDLKEIEKLLNYSKVVAVGEIGLDRYVYQKTKYQNYQIDKEFIELQKLFFIEQLKLAKKYKKAVIIHNRQANEDILKTLTDYNRFQSIPTDLTDCRLVFHCCESDEDLLNFAIKNKIFIGIDGDVYFSKIKQEFVKKIPLELLVLETDAPFLSPIRQFPNEPKNLQLIVSQIAKIINKKEEEIKKITTENAKKLFNL